MSQCKWVCIEVYSNIRLCLSVAGKQIWLSCGIIALFFMLLPIWIVLAIKNKYTNDVIYSGWTPVLSAMVISSLGGVILDFAVSSYHGIAVFQPVINGLFLSFCKLKIFAIHV